jgi:hypothetical protein
MGTPVENMAAYVYVEARRAHAGGDPLPKWEELSEGVRRLIEAAFALGVRSAAEYVGGNWDTAGEMAEHLREFADGKIPLYADE